MKSSEIVEYSRTFKKLRGVRCYLTGFLLTCLAPGSSIETSHAVITKYGSEYETNVSCLAENVCVLKL